MIRLIKNEMVKIFSKISTYLMLAMILLFAAAMVWLMRGNYNYSGNHYTYDTEAINEQIGYLESSKPQGYELELKQYEYMKNSGTEWTEGTWQLEALREAFQTWQSPLIYGAEALTEEQKNQYQQAFDFVMEPVLKDEWEKYAQAKLQQIQAEDSSEEKKAAESYYYEYMLEKGIEPGAGDWREETILLAGTYKVSLAEWEERKASGSYTSDEEKSELQNDLAVCEYRLEHDIPYYMNEDGHTESGFWNSFSEGKMILTLASVLMIVLAGGCIANEFSAGTIKFLLINPVKRSKIIVSKYLTLLILAVALILAVFGVNALINLVAYGAGDLGMPILTAADGVVSVGNPWPYFLGQYFLGGINLAVMTTMAFMISSLLRNSAVAIGIGVAALMGGNVLSMLLAQFECDWGRYVLFSNLDIPSIAQGRGMFPNQTPGFAAAVLAVYVVIFLITAYDAFTRREV